MSFLRSILLTLLTSTLSASRDTNPSALLKPQTPIAGTNLFLNVPYKMHDRKRPGCYATWFTKEYKDLSGKFKGVEIVCNKHDQVWYNTLDASWIFERTEGSESIAEYKGTVKVKNLGAKLTLETWKSSGVWWVGLGQYAGKTSEDMWNIQSDPKNKDNLQLEVADWWLHQRPTDNHRSYVALEYRKPADYPYSFVNHIELEAKMYSFTFTKPIAGQIAQHTRKKDLVDTYEVNNDSPGTMSRTITVSRKVTNEFAWGFSEALKAFTKVSGKAGIPLLAEGSVEVGLELNLSANQNWKDTTETMFSMAYQVNIPAYTKIKVSAWYDLIDNIKMPYTANTEIFGKGTRITNFDDLVLNSPATGNMIKKQLEYSKFDGNIIEIKEFSVIAQVKGIMVAKVGVRGQLNVNGKSVKEQVVTK